MYERQELCKDGVCHLVYEYGLPALPEGRASDRMEKFLADICREMQKRAEAALPRLAARYEGDTDPKKALRHRPLLFSLVFSLTKKRSAALVTATLTLSRSGRTLAKKERVLHFDLQSGYLLPL